jgi:DNA processing protein
MGRLVFAVPGSPLDPRAEGANGLLKDGAILVTEAADVIDALLPLTAHTPTGRAIHVPPDLSGLSDHASPDLGSSISAPASVKAHDSRGPQSGESHTREIQPPDNGDRARLTEALGPTPIGVDELVRHTGLHPAQISMLLLELDLAGRLERHSGGSVSLILGDL